MRQWVLEKQIAQVRMSQYFNDADHDIYYGDCDEVQDENSVSFEPFLEAKDLLKVSSLQTVHPKWKTPLVPEYNH